jgi:hypothetical protein
MESKQVLGHGLVVECQPRKCKPLSEEEEEEKKKKEEGEEKREKEKEKIKLNAVLSCHRPKCNRVN